MIPEFFGLILLFLLSYSSYALFFRPYLRSRRYVKKYGKRCKSFFYPIIGIRKFTNDYLKSDNDSFKWVRNLLKDDNDVQFLIGQGTLLIVDAELAKEITFDYYQDLTKPGVMEFHRLLLKEGLVFADGEKWKKQRNYLSHAFSYNILEKRIPIFNQIISKCVKNINTKNGLEPIHLSQECQRITSQVVLRVFFGDNFCDQLHDGQELGCYLAFIIGLALKQSRRLRILIPRLLFPQKIKRLFHDNDYKEDEKKVLKFRQLIEDEVDRRFNNYSETKTGTKDFLDIMVEEHFKNKLKNQGEAEDYVSKQSIVHQFIVFFFAGMDTTASVATMVIYWIAKRNDINEKVKKEIESIFQNNEEEVTQEKLKKLDFCHMLIMEVLRYHSPLAQMIQRKSLKNLVIGGDIHIPKGQKVSVSLHGLMRREKYFDNPDEFIPERFSESNKQKINHLAFIPFSSGPKNCIGQHMALIEVKIILVQFIRHFDIFLNEKVPLRMGYTSLYTPHEDELVFLKQK